MAKPAFHLASARAEASRNDIDSSPGRRANSARPVAILVLGMHRSGTSAVTRVINLLGADLSSNLMPAAKDNNEVGFWESMDACELNDAILASAYSSWDDWTPVNTDWIGSAEKKDFRKRAQEILEQDFSTSSLFVLKDPRLCRLLPFWLEVLKAFDAEPKFVLTVRNPVEVAASQEKRDRFNPAKSHRLWLRHVLDSERETRGLTRTVVAYDALIADWRSTVSKMAAELHIDWSGPSAAVETEIDGFLQPSHRHHAAEGLEIDDHPDVAAWVKAAHAALIELQAHPSSSAALKSLDEVRAEFDRATDVTSVFLGSEGTGRMGAATPSWVRQDRPGNGGAAAIDSRIAELTARLVSEKKRTEEMRRSKTEIALRLNEIQMSASWQLSIPLFAAESRWPSLMRRIAALPKLAWWTITLRLTDRLRLRRQAMELLANGLFDLRWYVEQNPDIVLRGINPITHWLVEGWKEDRDPNPWFDTAGYLGDHPELAESDTNPLMHYLASQDKGNLNGKGA